MNQQEKRIIRIVPWANWSIRWFYVLTIRVARKGVAPDVASYMRGDGYLLPWRGELFSEADDGVWLPKGGSWLPRGDRAVEIAGGRAVVIEFVSSLPLAGSPGRFEWPNEDAVVFYRGFVAPFRHGRVEVVEHSIRPRIVDVCILPEGGKVRRVGRVGIKDGRVEIRWRQRRRRGEPLVLVLHFASGRCPSVVALAAAFSVRKELRVDRLTRVECFGMSGLIFSLPVIDPIEVRLVREARTGNMKATLSESPSGSS